MDISKILLQLLVAALYRVAAVIDASESESKLNICHPDSFMKPFANDTGKYYVCKDHSDEWDTQIGVWELVSCGDGEEFVESRQKCVNKTRVRKQYSMCNRHPEAPMCSGYQPCGATNANPQEGRACTWATAPMTSHPSQRGQYMQCQPQPSKSCGVWRAHSCAPDCSFNSNLQLCVKDEVASVANTCGSNSQPVCNCGEGNVCPGRCSCNRGTCCSGGGFVPPSVPPPMRYPMPMPYPQQQIQQNSVGYSGQMPSAPNFPAMHEVMCPSGVMSNTPCESSGCPSENMCYDGCCCPDMVSHMSTSGYNHVMQSNSGLQVMNYESHQSGGQVGGVIMMCPSGQRSQERCSPAGCQMAHHACFKGFCCSMIKGPHQAGRFGYEVELPHSTYVNTKQQPLLPLPALVPYSVQQGPLPSMKCPSGQIVSKPCRHNCGRSESCYNDFCCPQSNPQPNVNQPYPQPQPQPGYPRPQQSYGVNPLPIVSQPRPQPVYPQPRPRPIYPQPRPRPVYPQPKPQPIYPRPQPRPQPVYPRPMPRPVYPKPQPMPTYPMMPHPNMPVAPFRPEPSACSAQKGYPVCQCASNRVCPKQSTCASGVCCGSSENFQQTGGAGYGQGGNMAQTGYSAMNMDNFAQIMQGVRNQYPGAPCMDTNQCAGGGCTCSHNSCQCNKGFFSNGVECMPAGQAPQAVNWSPRTCCDQFGTACMMRYSAKRRSPVTIPKTKVKDDQTPVFFRPLPTANRTCTSDCTCTPEEVCVSGRCLRRMIPGEFGCTHNRQCSNDCATSYCHPKKKQCLCRKSHAFVTARSCLTKCPVGTRATSEGLCKLILTKQTKILWQKLANEKFHSWINEHDTCGPVPKRQC